MPLAQFLQAIRSQCRYCSQQAGIFHRNHQECQETHQSGWQEMVSLVAQAATDHSFNEAVLRQSLSAIANRSRATGEDIERALEEGFAQGVAQAMADGIITRDEEERLRAFRDRFALEIGAVDLSPLAELYRAGADQVTAEARLAAISVQDVSFVSRLNFTTDVFQSRTPSSSTAKIAMKRTSSTTKARATTACSYGEDDGIYQRRRGQ